MVWSPSPRCRKAQVLGQSLKNHISAPSYPFSTLMVWSKHWSVLKDLIKPVHPKGSQPWIFIGRTDAEAEAPILWPPDAKSRLIGKNRDTGKDWRQKKGDARDRDGWMASLTKWTWVWGSNREACCPEVHGVEKSWTQLSDWTRTVIVGGEHKWVWSQDSVLD